MSKFNDYKVNIEVILKNLDDKEFQNIQEQINSIYLILYILDLNIKIQ